MHADTVVWSIGVYPVTVADTRSLDFIQTRFLMKLFETGCLGIIRVCFAMLNTKSVSNLILDCKRNFLTKFVEIDYSLICSATSSITKSDINNLM